MTRYQLVALSLLIASAQVAIQIGLGDGRSGEAVSSALGALAVWVVAIVLLLRGARWVIFVLMPAAAISTALALVRAVQGDQGSAAYVAQALLNVAGGLVIWMIYQETKRLVESDGEPSMADTNPS